MQVITRDSCLEQKLERLKNWKLIHPNVKPCRFTLARKKIPKLDVRYNIFNTHLQQVSRAKLVVVILQHNLKWDYHINEMICEVDNNTCSQKTLKVRVIPAYY